MAAIWRWLAPQLRSCSSFIGDPLPSLPILTGRHLLRSFCAPATSAEASLQPGDLRKRRGQLVGQAGSLPRGQVVDVNAAGLRYRLLNSSDGLGGVAVAAATVLLGCGWVVGGRGPAAGGLLRPGLVHVGAGPPPGTLPHPPAAPGAPGPGAR